MSLPIAISGATGRMGRALAELAAAATDLELIGGIDRSSLDASTAGAHGYPTVFTPDEAGPLLARARVLIDFSAPEQLASIVSILEGSGGPEALVVGTTGLDPALERRVHSLAVSRAVMMEANFSVGVQLLLALVEQAAAALPLADYDIEIVEAHHRSKADAPSGTALAIGRSVALARSQELERVRRDGRTGRPGARPPGEVGLHAVRGGGVVGEHRVLFLGTRERLELTHSAMDRAVFAEGALRAARWLAGQAPGRYTLREALGIA